MTENALLELLRKGEGEHVRTAVTVFYWLCPEDEQDDKLVAQLGYERTREMGNDMQLTPAMKPWAYKQHGIKGDDHAAIKTAIGTAITSGEIDSAQLIALSVEKGNKMNPGTQPTQADLNHGYTGLPPEQAIAKAASMGSLDGDSSGRGRYSQERTVGKHFRTLESVHPAFLGGLPALLPSQHETAMAGAYLKHLAKKAGINLRWEQEDQQLLEDCFTCGPWSGKVGNLHHSASLPGLSAKAILNDATSGGAEISPYFFDSALITFPLLHSELLPYVDIMEVPRGTTVEGGSIGNPTVVWGTAEGSSLTPFTTTSLIADISGTIYPVQVAVEVGRDFLSDSPTNVGQVLMENVAKHFLAELDKVIAVGSSGSSQPTGIMNASGTTTVTSVNGTGGPLMIDDAENLIFGLGKQYRNPSWNPAFMMADTTYKRFRQIPRSALDVQRVFGMNHQAYSMLEYPVRIQNNLTNSQVAFLAFRKYRLWRRLGMESRWITEGQTLALKNTTMLICRGRFGGRVADGAACAIMTSAPA